MAESQTTTDSKISPETRSEIYRLFRLSFMDELVHDDVSLGYMNKAYDLLSTKILETLKSSDDSQEKLASIQEEIGEILFDLKEKQDKDKILYRNVNTTNFFDLYKKILPMESFKIFNDLIKSIFEKIDDGTSEHFNANCFYTKDAEELDEEEKKMFSDSIKAELDEIIEDISKTVNANFTKFKNLVKIITKTLLDNTLDTDSKKTAKIAMIMVDLMHPDIVESKKQSHDNVTVHVSKEDNKKSTVCPVCCGDGNDISTKDCTTHNGTGKVDLFKTVIEVD